MTTENFRFHNIVSFLPTLSFWVTFITLLCHGTAKIMKCIGTRYIFANYAPLPNQIFHTRIYTKHFCKEGEDGKATPFSLSRFQWLRRFNGLEPVSRFLWLKPFLCLRPFNGFAVLATLFLSFMFEWLKPFLSFSANACF